MEDKISAVTLVRDFFGATINDFKALSSQDRVELGSAVAREQGLTALNFTPVEYYWLWIHLCRRSCPWGRSHTAQAWPCHNLGSSCNGLSPN